MASMGQAARKVPEFQSLVRVHVNEMLVQECPCHLNTKIMRLSKIAAASQPNQTLQQVSGHQLIPLAQQAIPAAAELGRLASLNQLHDDLSSAYNEVKRRRLRTTTSRWLRWRYSQMTGENSG